MAETRKPLFITDLRILLEVLLEHDVLSELLVMVLESRPGGKIGGLREAGHVELLAGGVSTLMPDISMYLLGLVCEVLSKVRDDRKQLIRDWKLE